MNKQFYTEMKGAAKELLGFFGRKATCTNPEDRGAGAGLAVITSPKIEGRLDDSYIMSTQKVIYFEAVGNFTPETGGVIGFGKTFYVISGVDPINPDDSTPIIFKLLVAV